MHGALARHADAIVDGLDADAREQARRILVRLVQFADGPAGGTRRREELAALRSRRDPGAWDRALAALVAARLLVRRGEDPRRATLEVAHEALIRRWERLWTWYQADRDRLARARELDRLVAQWREYGPLTGKALAFAHELVRGLDGDDLPPDAREMLAVSQRLADRRTRLRRAAIGGTLALLATFLTVVSLLYVASERNFHAAEASRAEADRSAERMGFAARLAAAERLRDDRPHLAAALLRDVPPAEFPGWRELAWNLLQTPLPTIWTGPTPRADHVTFAADGSFVAGYPDGALRAFPASGGAPILAFGAGPVQALALAPDEARLYVVRPTTIEVWQRRGDALVRRGETELRAGPDRRLVVGARTGRVVLSAGDVHLVFEPDGDRLVPRGIRDGCLTVDAGSEQRICRAGDDAVVVETWSGEPIGRVDSPGLSGARGTHGGLFARPGPLIAWHWPGAGATLVRHEVDAAHVGDVVAFVLVTHGGLAWRNGFGPAGGERMQWCTGGGGVAHCVEDPVGMVLDGIFADQVLLGSHEQVELRNLETRAIARTLRGPDSIDRRCVVDPRGLVALFDDDGRVWRWDLRRPRSGVLTFGLAPGASRLAALQPAKGRLVAATTSPDALVARAWSLPGDAPHEHGRPRSATIPLVRGERLVHGLIDHDTLVARIAGADGSERLVLGDVRGDAIALRPAAIPIAADTEVVAVDPAGAHVFTRRAGALARRSLGDPDASSETLAVDVTAGSPVLVDPRGRWLAVVDPADAELTLVDLRAPGSPARARASIVHAAFAPDGGTLALARVDGAIDLVRIGPEGQLLPGAVLRRHRVPPHAIAFSADGGALVSADEQQQIVLWTELDAPAPRSVTTPSRGSVAEVGFSPGGAQIWALSRLGELRFWSVFGADRALQAALRGSPEYCLSAREWRDLVAVSPADAEVLAARACPTAGVPSSG